MQPSLWKTVVLLGGLLFQLAAAQQYAGDFINNSLPSVPGSEIAYFKIKEPTGKTPKAYNLTLINYQALQTNGQRIVPSQIQRAVIIIHGLNRDPGTYISNIMSALSQVGDSNINRSNVALMAPYFPNGDDKNVGYPYNETNPANPGKNYTGSARSYTGALVWQGSAWSGGGANQYPAAYTSVSSFHVLDQLVQWYGNKTVFPNVKEIVVAGHSLGGQTVQRYAAMGQTATQLGVSVPVSYWIANPNSYVWLNSSRPLSTSSCPSYDQWRDGLQNFTGYSYPAVYNSAVTGGSIATIQANYYAKNKAYARGLLDTGDDSSGCQPGTSGANRNERFFAFINWFPATCPSPLSTSGHCDTIDFMNIGHDAGSMMASPAGQARLFTDNFYGNGSRDYDYGYPRVQAGDDPFPNPDLVSNTTANSNVYAGNMTLQGCYSDVSVATLPYKAYENSSNTIELCTSTCNAAGYSIAGVEAGTQCFCGNALGYAANMVVNTACSSTCAGNSSETCGGGSRINIYSNGTPPQSATPGNPDSVYNANYDYLNCYGEATTGRALSAKGYTDPVNMTLESCAAFCSGYQYFGVEYAQECYCGSCFNAGSAVIASGKCAMTCTGDASEFCGGSYALSVYKLDPASSLTPIAQSCNAASSTTTGASSIPTASLCPNMNGLNVTDSNNNTYAITCSSDSSQGSYASASAANSYLDCMTACDSASSTGCTGFTYVGAAYGGGSGTCYLKTAMGSYIASGTNLISGVKPSSGSSSSSTTSATNTASSTSSAAASLCPNTNGSNVTNANNNTYTITCASDSSQGSYASAQAANSYLDCLTACDSASATGCTGFTYVGAAYGGGSGTCYLKTVMGSYIASGSNLISGVKYSTGSSSSSSATSVTSTTSTVTSSSTSSASASLCPNANGLGLISSSNNTYTITCSSDSSQNSYASASAANSYLDCMTSTLR